jgi:hypothetical protein
MRSRHRFGLRCDLQCNAIRPLNRLGYAYWGESDDIAYSIFLA